VANMQKLAEMIRQLENELAVCMRCGMCQVVCPLFAETGREADVARGKLALLDGLTHRMFKDPKGVSARLNRCLLCGSCAADCPSGVRVIEVFLKARAILAGYLGLSPLKRAVFRKLLAHPETFDRLLVWGAKLQRFFIKPANQMLGTSCSRFVSPLGERHFKAIAAVPFHRRVPKIRTRSESSSLRVAFFPGCLIDKIYPQVGEAVLKSLEHHGVSVVVVEDLGCCGIPALSSGDSQTFTSLVAHNLHRIFAEPFDYVLTACATCTSTIRKLWPLMGAGEDSESRKRLSDLAARTMDIADFLVTKLGVGVESQASCQGRKVVSYHDPCHLKKSLGVAAQPRALLRACPQVEFKEMPEADWCCGCGGSFNLEHYETSRAIGMRKRGNIIHAGCQVVATGCPACMLQIADMLSQAGDPIQVRHVIELYAEGLEVAKKSEPAIRIQKSG
jgi:glycolate oxidase iron-sulfur subunit